MATRPIRKKILSRRPKKTPARARKPAPSPEPVRSGQAVSPRSWRKGWMAFAYLAATGIFLSPINFHSPVKAIDFAGSVEDKDRFFRDYLTLYEKGDQAGVVSLLSPESQDFGKKEMGQMMESFQKVGAFQDCRLLNTTWLSKGPSWEMVYYLDYEKGFGVADFKIHREGNGFKVDKFYIKPMYQPFDQVMDFPSLMNISIEKVLFILFGYLLTLWNANTLVQCCYSPLNRKWLWILFILTGFGSISIPLDPGYTSFHWSLFTAHTPVVEIMKFPLWEPWAIRFTIPLGIIAFLGKMKKMEDMKK